MCGIAGIVALDPGRVRPALLRAQQAQKHRGPDGDGINVQQVGRWTVGLGHQRLAILDLSTSGQQPMSAPGGRHWLSFNGEVYNYLEIRAELKGLKVLV